jgi:arginine decarboxylase
MSPGDAYEQLVRGNVDRITLDQLEGRVLVTGVGYLKALEAFDMKFPRFMHDTHGIVVEDGAYGLLVIQK